MTAKEAKDTLIRIERKAKDITGFSAEDWVGIQAAIRHLTDYIDSKEHDMNTLDEAAEKSLGDNRDKRKRNKYPHIHTDR